MKQLKVTPGIPCAPKKAEPICDKEEEILWKKGLLGSHSPQSLVDTMVYMAGLYFALRSGEEHRQLRFGSVELIEKEGSTPYLLYTESVSKNNPGGLKHRKVSVKQVTHHANTECPQRCFVQMYKEYCFHRPDGVKDDAFYLSPIPNAAGKVWYKRTPIGVNTLATTVKRLCEKAGISGYKTNHSLRVTTATRLFKEGVDEQLIMERTGHRSTDGVRSYKRSCMEQQETVSHILNREKMSHVNLVPPAAFTSTSISTSTPISTPSSGKENQPPQPSEKVDSLSSLTLTGCTGITINYNIGKD